MTEEAPEQEGEIQVVHSTEKKPEPIKCPICGKVNEPDASECKMCRTELKPTEEGKIKLKMPRVAGDIITMVDIEDPGTRKTLEELALIPGVTRMKAVYLYQSGITSIEEYVEKAFHGERRSDNFTRMVTNKILMSQVKGKAKKERIPCPSCKAPNDPKNTRCKACGFEIELEMATLKMDEVKERLSRTAEEVFGDLMDSKAFTALPEDLKAQVALVLDSDDFEDVDVMPEAFKKLGVDSETLDIGELPPADPVEAEEAEKEPGEAPVEAEEPEPDKEANAEPEPPAGEPEKEAKAEVKPEIKSEAEPEAEEKPEEKPEEPTAVEEEVEPEPEAEPPEEEPEEPTPDPEEPGPAPEEPKAEAAPEPDPEPESEAAPAPEPEEPAPEPEAEQAPQPEPEPEAPVAESEPEPEEPAEEPEPESPAAEPEVPEEPEDEDDENDDDEGGTFSFEEEPVKEEPESPEPVEEVQEPEREPEPEPPAAEPEPEPAPEPEAKPEPATQKAKGDKTAMSDEGARKMAAQKEKIRKALIQKVEEWGKAGYDTTGLDDYLEDVKEFKEQAKTVLKKGKVIKKQYQIQLEAWKEKGFDVSELEPLLETDVLAFKEKSKEVLKSQKK